MTSLLKKQSIISFNCKPTIWLATLTTPTAPTDNIGNNNESSPLYIESEGPQVVLNSVTSPILPLAALILKIFSNFISFFTVIGSKLQLVRPGMLYNINGKSGVEFAIKLKCWKSPS